MTWFIHRCGCTRPHVWFNIGRKTWWPERPWFIEIDVAGWFFGVQGKELA